MRILFREVRRPMRATHPKWERIAEEVAKVLEAKVKPRLLSYAERVVDNWEHKPKFVAKKRVSKGGISVTVYPTGPNRKYWVWTSRGTRRHKIKPKAAHRGAMSTVLAFPESYTPKTSPRGPSYGGPGRYSGSTIFAYEVDHPGTRPRKFEEAWGRWAKTWFRREVENAMRRGIRAA